MGGLGPLDLERLRQEHLTQHPTSAGAAHVKFLASKGFEANGQLKEALDASEAALQLESAEPPTPPALRLAEQAGPRAEQVVTSALSSTLELRMRAFTGPKVRVFLTSEGLWPWPMAS